MPISATLTLGEGTTDAAKSGHEQTADDEAATCEERRRQAEGQGIQVGPRAGWGTGDGSAAGPASQQHRTDMRAKPNKASPPPHQKQASVENHLIIRDTIQS